MSGEGEVVDGKQLCHPCADSELGLRYALTPRGKNVLDKRTKFKESKK